MAGWSGGSGARPSGALTTSQARVTSNRTPVPIAPHLSQRRRREGAGGEDGLAAAGGGGGGANGSGRSSTSLPPFRQIP